MTKCVTNIVDVVAGHPADPPRSRVPGLEGMIETGASPRASIYLMKAAKAHAFLAEPELRPHRTT